MTVTVRVEFWERYAQAGSKSWKSKNMALPGGRAICFARNVYITEEI